MTRFSAVLVAWGMLFTVACGGGDEAETATTEDTTSVAPVTEPAPIGGPADTAMAAPITDSTAAPAVGEPGYGPEQGKDSLPAGSGGGKSKDSIPRGSGKGKGGGRR